MNVKSIYIFTGYLSIAIGILAAMSIYRMQFMMYGIGLAILGLLTGGVNIFLNSKYYYEQEKFPKGYLGIFLSSLPVIFMLLIIFKFRK